MGKSLKAVLFLLLSIYILVLSPLFSVLAKEQNHHHSFGRKHNLSKVHLNNTTWNLIENRQLSTPPGIDKSKTSVLFFAVLSFLGFILCLQNVKRTVPRLKQNLFYIPAPPLYLLNSLLLI